MNNSSKRLLVVFFAFIFFNCELEKNYTKGSFGEDIAFLNKYIDDLVILEDGQSLVAVSPKLQGRVFTTSTNGYHGKSLGYFNKEFIASEHQQLSKIGGESRMWFGPEVGDFSIFFPPNVAQTGENMRISQALDTTLFKVTKITDRESISSNRMEIQNAFGTTFKIDALRKITLNSKSQAENNLSISIPKAVNYVGFSARTEVTSLDEQQWQKASGLLPIWDLGCMLPSDHQWVIIPTTNTELKSVTNYFTPQEGRVVIKNGVVFYKVDAKYLNKMGIPKQYIKPIMGSYSPEFNLLNIVTYSFSNDSLYVSSDWESSKNYEGDVMNIFNGEVNPELDRNYPFFEFESFSAAKELKPNEKLQHVQSIYHFEGDKDDLDLICKEVLGVELSQIPLKKIE
ncbi:DUF6786 family protein [Flammeovirga sp. OC4]|uniref:DUF6786 family protein n=1 Tax=Flammeovirga sp. OC4 TaxID=1382345 RepID=UPI0005C62F42|nr:DUF6786 family protein [Flammeovirga sp. OC4]